MSLNAKTLHRIKKFGRARFEGNPVYSERSLIKAYKNASKEMREEMEKEIDVYMEAINSGRLKAGESILRLATLEEELPPTN